MPTSENALVRVESGQTLVPYAAATNSGDGQFFTFADSVLSGKAAFAALIRPNGILTGSDLVSIAVSGSDDVVDVAGFTAYSMGVLQTVSASADESITRPAGNVAKINSITMTSVGSIAVIAGIDAADAVFIETRGGAGGPPYIPADSVELGQVRIASSASAPIASSEIVQVVGQHAERSDFPTYDVDNVGLGRASSVSAETNAHIKMAAVLPGSHTGDATKNVWVQYYTPIFSSISRSSGYTPAETSHSTSSTTYYGGAIGASTASLGQGGFTVLMKDGITDALVKDKDEILTVQFFQDRNKDPFQLTQGKIGLSRAFEDSAQVTGTVTISSETASADFEG